METTLETTIATYNRFFKKYIKYTENKQPITEFNAFCSHLPPHGIILDAGCAWGRDCKTLAARNFIVKGVDLSKNLLEYARIYTQNYATLCEFYEADVRQLPFPNDFFDGIWCCACLLHLEKEHIEEALTELRRVLKTNGVCALLLKKGRGADFQPYYASNNTTNTTHSLRYFTYFQEDELRDLCTNTGFKIIEQNTTYERDTQSSKGRNQEWIYTLLRK